MKAIVSVEIDAPDGTTFQQIRDAVSDALLEKWSRNLEDPTGPDISYLDVEVEPVND